MNFKPRMNHRASAGSKLALADEDAGTSRFGLAFVGCVDRLQQLIDRESRALVSGEAVDFEAFNSKKTRALLEFMRVSRSYAAPRSPMAETKLARLRESLLENSSLLEQHLRAVREISGIMIRTIEMADSDGTYSKTMLVDR